MNRYHKAWQNMFQKQGYVLLIAFYLLTLTLSSCTLDTSTSNQASQSGISTEKPRITPDVQATATAVQQQKWLSKADQILQGMTLEDKLAQMLIVEYLGADYQQSGLQEMIAQQHVGGFLIQPNGDDNFNADTTVDSVQAFNAQAQKDSSIPLLIAIDQEGGLVDKLAYIFDREAAASDIAASGNPDTAYQAGVTAAQHMHQVGINTNLAPVVDVGPTTTLLTTRKYSDDPQVVAQYAGKFLDGVQHDQTALGTLKHFPGLGTLPLDDDPHDMVPHDTRSLSELETHDFVPYKQLIQNNHPAMIMATDVYIDAVDSTLPAELSPKVIGILRQEMHYNGVIITDGIYMLKYAGYTNSIADVTTQAIIAGNDIVEGPINPATVTEIIMSLKQALQSGKLTEQHINDSVRRILLMKLQYGIIAQ